MVDVKQTNVIHFICHRREIKRHHSTILVVIRLCFIPIVFLDDQYIAQIVTVLVWIVTVRSRLATFADTNSPSWTLFVRTSEVRVSIFSVTNFGRIEQARLCAEAS